MIARLARSLRSLTTRPQVATPRSAPAFEQLEKRQMLAVSPIVAGTKIKSQNLFTNGVSANSTAITIPFTGNIHIADMSKIQVRGYAFNPLSPTLGQIKKVVNVISATVLATDFNNDGIMEHTYLQIKTDRLMRKGGKIIFYAGCLTDDNGDTLAEQTRQTVQGLNKERFTLANRAFRPGNFNRFTPDIFSLSPTPTNANVAAPEATVTADLQIFMDKKVAAGTITQAQEDAAMTRYNSTSLKGLIPDANLRAALMSLTGTFAEGAISSIVDGTNITGKPYTIITFQDPPDPSVPVAQTSPRPTDGRLRTVFKPAFRGESFQILSCYIAHEALHQDTTFTLPEETFANTTETLIAIQQAQTDVAFLKAGTNLVNLQNDSLLAFINSGRTIFPYPGTKDAPMLNANLGVFQGQKLPAADGGGVYTSFLDWTRRNYIARGSPNNPSPGNALLNSYYTNLTGKPAAANMQFTNSLEDDIDAFQGIAGTHQVIKIAQALHVALA